MYQNFRRTHSLNCNTIFKTQVVTYKTKTNKIILKTDHQKQFFFSIIFFIKEFYFSMFNYTNTIFNNDKLKIAWKKVMKVMINITL